jgi:hypothetical protein
MKLQSGFLPMGSSLALSDNADTADRSAQQLVGGI